MRGDWRDSVAPSLALFSSASTLLCCALPALLISIGAGAVMAGLTAEIPGIMWLSAHKDILFVLSGGLMALGHARDVPCPAQRGARQVVVEFEHACALLEALRGDSRGVFCLVP